MLRSCLAMILCGITSFDVWVQMMRTDPFYALISGFDPIDTPGVGTFYDFQDRLLHRPRQPRTHHRRPYRRRNQRDKAKQHRDKNDLRPHQNIVKRLAERMLARSDQPAPLVAAVLAGYGDFSALPLWEQTLQPLFMTCFVARSVDLNLIDLDHLNVAADGTKLRTWANPGGKKLCDCDNRNKKREERCRCHRAYNDPLALSVGLGQLPRRLGLWSQLLRTDHLQPATHLPVALGLISDYEPHLLVLVKLLVKCFADRLCSFLHTLPLLCQTNNRN